MDETPTPRHQVLARAVRRVAEAVWVVGILLWLAILFHACFGGSVVEIRNVTP